MAAQLTISFNLVPDIITYNICYKVVDSFEEPICIESSESYVVITEGIECGVQYEVTISSNCPEGYSTTVSLPATTLSNVAECLEGAGTCYSIEIPFEVGSNGGETLFIGYEDVVQGYILREYDTFLSFDSGSGVIIPVCSVSGEPRFRYGFSGFEQIVEGVVVTMGGSCGSSSECTSSLNETPKK
jgi:hypothetical protein